MNQLEQLKTMTVVVADSGDFHSFVSLKPQDATTNPSLLYNAAQDPAYASIVQAAVEYGKNHSGTIDQQVAAALDKLAVGFGCEILKIVPGRVSTEIDARFSFDVDATVHKARELFKLYQDAGVDPAKRVLFKIASTWEGIRAAERLEKEGIHTNMTLLFSFCQAVAAADAGVTLISPFVGRILDFWKKELNKDIPLAEDPGVQSVTQIYNYYKKFGYKTIVMGASFRSKDEALALAGCDYLTIAPKLLQEMQASKSPVERKLDPEKAKTMDIKKVTYDEKSFRWAFNEDPCACYKLPEGIRNFAKDTIKLEQLIKSKMA
jgi:transaldolase